MKPSLSFFVGGLWSFLCPTLWVTNQFLSLCLCVSGSSVGGSGPFHACGSLILLCAACSVKWGRQVKTEESCRRGAGRAERSEITWIRERLAVLLSQDMPETWCVLFSRASVSPLLLCLEVFPLVFLINLFFCWRTQRPNAFPLPWDWLHASPLCVS